MIHLEGAIGCLCGKKECRENQPILIEKRKEEIRKLKDRLDGR